MLELLRKPFPEIENWADYFIILLVLSLFVTGFLYVFQPFGIATLESNKFLICLGFGAMTFLGATVYEFIVHKIFKLRERQAVWTFGKWILDMLGIMFSISLANFLFVRIVIFGTIDWELFPHMIYGTFMVGIIPIVIFGGWLLSKNEKKYVRIADEINLSKSGAAAPVKTVEHLIFDIPSHQIRYIEALQNYARIGYLNTEGILQLRTERITLKRILAETKGTPIIKCHRSYLVNKDAIITAKGNAQGLLLSLSDCDKQIPVSRTRVAVFRSIYS